MRLVIQRVTEASVSVAGRVEGKISTGLLIFVGIESGDNTADADWLSEKVARLRIFPDDKGVMNLSVKDIHGNILVISQFTLHASTRKGNRPSYIRAAHPDTAIPLYHHFITQLENHLGSTIQTGVFGAMMDIALVNDGPVTIVIDSRNRE